MRKRQLVGSGGRGRAGEEERRRLQVSSAGSRANQCSAAQSFIIIVIIINIIIVIIITFIIEVINQWCPAQSSRSRFNIYTSLSCREWFKQCCAQKKIYHIKTGLVIWPVAPNHVAKGYKSDQCIAMQPTHVISSSESNQLKAKIITLCTWYFVPACVFSLALVPT